MSSRSSHATAHATRRTRDRYDRLARFYDLLERLPERGPFGRWRARLWAAMRAGATGGKILEVGVGTGKNMPYWPRGASITALDISPRMLERARRRAERLGPDAELWLMDWLDPLIVRIVGAHINRRTLENVHTSGLVIEEITDLAPMGMVRLIKARTPEPGA